MAMAKSTTVPADNPIDADLFSSLQRDDEVQNTTKVVSPDISFLKKCIHPPSSVPGFIGIPTNDARSQVLLEYRNVVMHNPAYGLSTSQVVALVTPPPAEFAFLVGTGLSALCIGFYTPDGQTWQQDFNNNDAQDLYTVTNFQADAQLYRPVYKSLTTYLNATSFNDTGFVTVNQFTPSLLFAGTLLEWASRDLVTFIKFIKCYHVYKPLKLSSTKCSFPSYVRREIAETLGFIDDAHFQLDPNTSVQVINFGKANGITMPVPSLSQTVQQSQRSYSGKALDGTFTVQRLNTLSPRWMTASNTQGATNGLYECYYNFTGSDGDQHFVPFNANCPIGTTLINLPVLMDTLWTPDMTWSWIHYSGVSYNDNQTDITRAQIIVRKYYSGHEVQPSISSPWSGMVKLGPKPNMQMMQILMDAFYDLKDGMPARYNFLGAALTALAPSLLKAAPQVIESITGMLSNKQRRGERAQRSDETTSTVDDNDRRLAKVEKVVDKLFTMMTSLSEQMSYSTEQHYSQPMITYPAEPTKQSKHK